MLINSKPVNKVAVNGNGAGVVAAALSAGLSAKSKVTVALTTKIQIRAALLAKSKVTASVYGLPAQLAATLSGKPSVSCGLSTQISLGSALVSSSALFGDLSTGISLTALLQCHGLAAADLSIQTRFRAALKTKAKIVTGLERRKIDLSAALVSGNRISARLRVGALLACNLRATSTVSSALLTAIQLRSLNSSRSVVGAGLDTRIRLSTICRFRPSVRARSTFDPDEYRYNPLSVFTSQKQLYVWSER